MSIGVAALVAGLIVLALIFSFDLEPNVMPDPSEGGARSPTPAFPPH
jgi:hypothetical protein